MGNLTSRQNIGVEEVDIVANNAYKYPPRSGNYFGSHFIMGGERFDTPQPEAYLFGENVDLNFLGNRPTPFPYPPPQANEPTKTLKSLVNIRRESVRFVRAPDSVIKTNFPEDETKENKFNIEFTFDCDSRCAITIYYFCSEEVTNTGLVYTSKFPSINSETFHFKKGSNQLFCQPSHVFDPSKFTEDEMTYDLEKEVVPIAIHCLAEEGVEGEPRQSHTTICVVDRHSDGTYVLRALKQKLYVDGLCYLLQEIYGIENKNNENAKIVNDEDTEDNGAECVICMCDVRDTLILPCRHLCLCNSCADSLRYQANNCPICRSPFRALLQIRALHKFSNCVTNPMHHEGSCDQIPPGYEAVSLVEALNGPYTVHPTAVVVDLAEAPSSETTVQAAEMLNRQSSIEEGKNIPGEGKIPEYRLSVLTSRDETNGRRTSSKNSRDKDRRSKGANIVERDEEKVPTEPDQCVDMDSDAEKLSPLLAVKKTDTASDNDKTSAQSPVETERQSKSEDSKPASGEDSDSCYTPDEPMNTAPVHSLYECEKDAPSPEGTPDRQPPGISLPGTPLSTSSHISARSSGDSYSSSSSTRHLLTHNLIGKQDRPLQVRQMKE